MFANVALKLSPEELLRILCRLRFLALCVTLASVVFLPLVLADQSRLPIAGFTAVLAVWTAAAWWRSRQGWPVTEWEVTLHLLADALMVGLVLLISGGSSSPFVALFLVPVGLAAAVLPAASAWLLVGVAALAYSLLIFWQPPHAQHGGEAFFLHVIGMWMTFLLAAVLLVVFVSAMAGAVRRREAVLLQTREQMLRAEQLSRVGLLAAGAAHELGTPLSTARTLLGDIQRKAAGDDELESDLADLSQQLALCGERLQSVLCLADEDADDAAVQPTGVWLEATLARWRTVRPATHLEIDIPPAVARSRLAADTSLAHTLTSLLDNAADASQAAGSAHIRLQARLEHDRLQLSIEDDGPGLQARDRARAGRVRFTHKPRGHGLGLVLSHTTLERLGGQLRLEDADGGGTRTVMSLPLAMPGVSGA